MEKEEEYLKALFHDLKKEEDRARQTRMALQKKLTKSASYLFKSGETVDLKTKGLPEHFCSAKIFVGNYTAGSVFRIDALQTLEFFPNAPCLTKWYACATPIGTKNKSNLQSVVISGTIIVLRPDESLESANERFFEALERGRLAFEKRDLSFER